jgi:transposase-like protein
VNTILEDQGNGRNRRRRHSDEFEADVVAARRQPGMAVVVTARGVNANLQRRWV